MGLKLETGTKHTNALGSQVVARCLRIPRPHQLVCYATTVGDSVTTAIELRDQIRITAFSTGQRIVA